MTQAFDIIHKSLLGCLHAGIGQSHIKFFYILHEHTTINSLLLKIEEEKLGRLWKMLPKKVRERATTLITN